MRTDLTAAKPRPDFVVIHNIKGVKIFPVMD